MLRCPIKRFSFFLLSFHSCSQMFAIHCSPDDKDLPSTLLCQTKNVWKIYQPKKSYTCHICHLDYTFGVWKFITQNCVDLWQEYIAANCCNQTLSAELHIECKITLWSHHVLEKSCFRLDDDESKYEYFLCNKIKHDPTPMVLMRPHVDWESCVKKDWEPTRRQRGDWEDFSSTLPNPQSYFFNFEPKTKIYSLLLDVKSWVWCL